MEKIVERARQEGEGKRVRRRREGKLFGVREGWEKKEWVARKDEGGAPGKKEQRKDMMDTLNRYKI